MRIRQQRDLSIFLQIVRQGPVIGGFFSSNDDYFNSKARIDSGRVNVIGPEGCFEVEIP